MNLLPESSMLWDGSHRIVTCELHPSLPLWDRAVCGHQLPEPAWPDGHQPTTTTDGPLLVVTCSCDAWSAASRQHRRAGDAWLWHLRDLYPYRLVHAWTIQELRKLASAHRDLIDQEPRR